jgi:ABC-type Zn uptake system ZnuABC Zn-binding protein ZnuA
VIEAAAGLTSRQPHTGEVVDPDHVGDPHFWLDPNNVIKYVENIRDGLSKVDPGGAATYRANADAYIAKLKDLDRWITDRVKEVPQANRLLVTNHESFGYFADRYGFNIIGTVMPSVSTGSAPSAQQLAQLIDHIKATGAKAIFLETGTNPQLAEQVARETGSKVVTNLYSHSITEANGPAPTYLDMMKFNTNAIVDALK